MNAREAIVSLLDGHTDALGMTRRQLADLAGVNAGQLSNWLRTTGPLAFTKEGKVADRMLSQARAALTANPNVQGAAAIKNLISVLEGYGPRRRLIAMEHEVAERGDPIAQDNPRYMRRMVDEELTQLMDLNRQRVLVVEGGSKMGKSTALLHAQQAKERAGMVLFIDCADYCGRRPASCGQNEAIFSFYRWFSESCQDQIVGGYRSTLDGAKDMVPWLKGQILPAAGEKRVHILLDHLDRLGEFNVAQVQENAYPEGSAHWEYRR